MNSRKRHSQKNSGKKKSSAKRGGPSGRPGSKYKDYGQKRRRGRPDDYVPDGAFRALKSNDLKMPDKELAEANKETHKSLRLWREQSQKLARTPYVPPEQPYDQLDPWQEEAASLMLAGNHVVVDAPTTAGKTRVVEAFFAHNIDRPEFRACYTCPVKSLSNDKVKEFKEMFGDDKVGISTGDVKENLDAPIVVATLESYRNSLLGIEPDLNRQLVVFDEYHYIQDPGRGTSWEEAMILTPHGCQMLLLSASIANPDQFVSWVENLQKNRTAKLVSVEERPVPLADLIYVQGAWVEPRHVEEFLPTKKLPDKLDSIPNEDLASQLREAAILGLTPCIVYGGKRISCVQLAHAIAKDVTPLAEEDREKISAVLQQQHQESGCLSQMPSELRSIIQGYGVGYHHSGLQPAVRVAIEALLKDGLLRFCTATMGLSLGINFSVRSALVSDYMRPGENGPTLYSSSEVQQMLGRAGRRGKDPVGYSLWPTVDCYRKFANRTRQPVQSQLKNEPTTFLGLTGRGFSQRAIEQFYKKSFLAFKNKNARMDLVKHSDLAKKLGESGLPCVNAADALGRFINDENSPCDNCPIQKKCHSQVDQITRSPLATTQLHLHRIGALTEENKLTGFGNIARFFPHPGGMVIADWIFHEKINADNIAEGLELMAAFSLAFFKAPTTSSTYELPFPKSEVEERLDYYYPLELFPDLYDPPFGRRSFYVIKEFNPAAGYVIREWTKGISWEDLVSAVANDKFSAGDISNLIYRSLAYLQTVSQMKFGEVSKMAYELREELLRPPIDFGIQ